jgi:hypothetical protein
MMFFRASGGIEYTDLTQRFQMGIDFSGMLTRNQAILCGRVNQPLHKIAINGVATSEDYDRAWTFYRIVLPVK